MLEVFEFYFNKSSLKFILDTNDDFDMCQLFERLLQNRKYSLQPTKNSLGMPV